MSHGRCSSSVAISGGGNAEELRGSSGIATRRPAGARHSDSRMMRRTDGVVCCWRAARRRNPVRRFVTQYRVCSVDSYSRGGSRRSAWEHEDSSYSSKTNTTLSLSTVHLGQIYRDFILFYLSLTSLFLNIINKKKRSSTI
jgi:hypothetical protein